MKSEMKPIRETISLEDARQLIAAACTPIERTERLRLVDANGRAAAADVLSRLVNPVPPVVMIASTSAIVACWRISSATRAGSSFSIAFPAT